MSEPIWQFFNAENTVVWREWLNGVQESSFVSAPEIQQWLAEGNTPNPYIPPPAPPPLTAAEKLEAAGLTVDELKELLGL